MQAFKYMRPDHRALLEHQARIVAESAARVSAFRTLYPHLSATRIRAELRAKRAEGMR